MDILNILGNKKRREILNLLLKKNIHISAIAKEVKISVPVALKHVNLLNDAKLIEKEKLGNTIIIKITNDAIEVLNKIEGIIEKPRIINIQKGTRLLDIIQEMPEFKIKKANGKYFIEKIDREKGYFIYKINGLLTNKGIDNVIINEDTTIEFEKLMPVLGKKIEVKVN